MILRQPLTHVGRHQKRLLAITRDEALTHRRNRLKPAGRHPTYATASGESSSREARLSPHRRRPRGSSVAANPTPSRAGVSPRGQAAARGPASAGVARRITGVDERRPPSPVPGDGGSPGGRVGSSVAPSSGVRSRIRHEHGRASYHWRSTRPRSSRSTPARSSRSSRPRRWRGRWSPWPAGAACSSRWSWSSWRSAWSIGPQVLDLAQVNAFTEFFADLGLGMLFFFAGYEIDLARIRGEPLRLALLGWAMSLAIAYTLGGVLAAGRRGRLAGLRRAPRSRRRRSARCSRSSPTPASCAARFGTLPARRGRGRGVRPDPAAHARPLDAERAAQRADPRRVRPGRRRGRRRWRSARRSTRSPLFERTIETSSQLAVRWIVVLVFALALLANELGLDLLLGGFAAGLITRQVLQRSEVRGVRLEAHRGRVRVLRAVLLRGERDAPRRGRAVLERRPASRSSRSSSCSSSSSAGRRRCCSTAASCRCGRTAWRSRSSARRSCRSWWRSRRSRSARGTCARRPPRRSWAPARCRRWPGPLHGLRMRRIAAEKRAAAGVVEAGALPAEAPAAP